MLERQAEKAYICLAVHLPTPGPGVSSGRFYLHALLFVKNYSPVD